MILIISHKEDFTVDFVVNKLNHKSIKYFRYNTEDLLNRNDIEILFKKGVFKFTFSYRDNIKSIWFRRIKYPDLNLLENNIKLFVFDELKVYLNNLWDLFDVKWLSNPKYIYRAENKFLQLKEAQKVGLNIPNTLITSNKDAIKKFFYENKENVIIKPIYGNDFIEDNEYKLIYTNKIEKDKIEKLDKYLAFPSIYQNNILKEIEIRSTVVGNEIFSAYVDSQSEDNSKIDWRKKRLKFYKYNLPEEINYKCIELVKNLNLSFGAIDIIKDKDGNYIFLEINPNGQWAWIELDTGLQISNSIINYLNI